MAIALDSIENILKAVAAKELPPDKAQEAMTALMFTQLSAGDVGIAVGPAGGLVLKFGGQFPVNLSAERANKLFSTGKLKMNEDGSASWTPKSVIADHPVIQYMRSKPTTKHPAREARTGRGGKLIPACPAFTAELGQDKRKDLGISEE